MFAGITQCRQLSLVLVGTPRNCLRLKVCKCWKASMHSKALRVRLQHNAASIAKPDCPSFLSFSLLCFLKKCFIFWFLFFSFLFFSFLFFSFLFFSFLFFSFLFFYFISFHFILFCFVLFCFVLFYFILFYFIFLSFLLLFCLCCLLPCSKQGKEVPPSCIQAALFKCLNKVQPLRASIYGFC